MTSVNTNTNPSNDQPYIPQGQSQVLSNTPDTNTVQPGAGGGGATVVVPRDTLIQNVPPGLQNTTGTSVTAPEITPNAPLLVPGALTFGSEPLLGGQLQEFINSFIPSMMSFFGVQQAPQQNQEDPTLVLPGGVVVTNEQPTTTRSSSTTSVQTESTTSTNTATAQVTDEDLQVVSQLYSTTEETVYNQLCVSVGCDPNGASSLNTALQSIARDMAAKNHDGGVSDLDSTSADKVLAALKSCYAGNDPEVLKALGAICDQLVAINVHFDKDLSSTNADVIERALKARVDITSSSLSQEDRAGMVDALKLLAQALAFLNDLRAKCLSMEGELTTKEGRAKLAQLKDMTDNALRGFEKGMKEIETNTKKMHQQLAMQRLMKILGPIIMIFIAIITVILTVFGGGAGSALGVGLIAATIAMAAFSVADSIGNVLDKMCDALHIKDQALRALLKMAVMLVMVVATGGVGMVAAAANMAGQLSVNLVSNITKAVVLGVIGLGMNCLFSSGVLTAAFTKLLKACGLSEEKAALGAMIITFIIMIAMLVAMLGAAASGGAKAAGQAGNLAKQGDDVVLEEVETATKTGGQQASTAVKTGATGIDQTLDSTVGQSSLARTIMNIGRSMKEEFSDPVNYLNFMRILASASQVASNVVTAKSEIEQGLLSKQQAKLEKQIAELNAMMSYLKTLLPGFDSSIQKLNEDTKEFANETNKMMEFFAQFISGLSQATNQATNRGV